MFGVCARVRRYNYKQQKQVFNRSTYGHFEQFLEMLGVDSEESDMRCF